MSKRKLVRKSKLLLVKTALGIITRGTTKVKGIQDSVVNVDQALTSNLILLSILRVLITTRILLIKQLIRLQLIEVLVEEGQEAIVTTLDITTLYTIILIKTETQNSILIVIQINTLNFRNLFRIEFTIRIIIEGFVLALREKIQKRSFSIKTPLRYNRLF